jgi:DNA invertase Pin-like site-specific DNA recombinase
MDGKFVSYLRVSTEKQGKSGLGIEAQRAAVLGYLNGGCWTLAAEFVEVESGKVDNRPKLEAALTRCKLTGARLVIAKLDRLSRDAAFLLGLQKAGVDFVAADMPDANKLTVGIMALVAQQEREAISARTKAALAAAKARGADLGGWRGGPKSDGAAARAAKTAKAEAYAASVRPTVAELHTQGLSLRQIAAALTADDIKTPRNGLWTADAVSRLLAG